MPQSTTDAPVSTAVGAGNEVTTGAEGSPVQTTESATKTFTQEQVNQLVGRARDEGRTVAKQELENDVTTRLTQALAERDQQIDQTVQDRVQAALTQQALTDTKAALISEFGLNDHQAAKLDGDTPDALRGSADLLFGALKIRKAPVLQPGGDTPRTPEISPLDAAVAAGLNKALGK